MTYKKIIPGEFLSRPNRFIAKVLIDQKEETVHVKNTGRCKELLIPGCKVFLALSDNPKRKTACDLVAVEKLRKKNTPLLVNMDSQAPNHAVESWLKKGKLFSKNALIRREVTYKKSRFDFYIEDGEKKAFLEVKGVTLENEGVALFPDAPTERGIKHLQELTAAIDEGFESYVLFVIQMKEVSLFMPNKETHPQFALALKEAQEKGVQVLAVDCEVGADYMHCSEFVKVEI